MSVSVCCVWHSFNFIHTVLFRFEDTTDSKGQGYRRLEEYKLKLEGTDDDDHDSQIWKGVLLALYASCSLFRLYVFVLLLTFCLGFVYM